jgi:hypothetical protein
MGDDVTLDVTAKEPVASADTKRDAVTLGVVVTDTVVLGKIEAVTDPLAVNDVETLPDGDAAAVTERLAGDAAMLEVADVERVGLRVMDADKLGTHGVEKVCTIVYASREYWYKTDPSPRCSWRT